MSTPKQIDPNSPEYKKAQEYLEKLFGYKNMYITPWQHAAVSIDGTLIHNSKVLLGKRAAHLEFPGCWHIPAGHVNVGARESKLEALERAIFGEHSLKIDISKIEEGKPLLTRYFPEIDYNAQKGLALHNEEYVYYLSDKEVSQITTSKEATGFMFADIAKLEELKIQGKLMRDFSYIYHLLK